MALLSGLVYVNETDIYDKYGAFLSEEKQGDRANLEAILQPSSLKENVAINFREVAGEKYADELSQVNEPRDVTLRFCIKATTKALWMSQYKSFIEFLKSGDKGWLVFNFPSLDLELTMYYKSCSKFSPLTPLWIEGVHAAHFKVVFREPTPIF